MKVVILSRDGLINRPLPDGVQQPDQWQPMPGSLEALARLQREGYRVVIATVQPGVANGAPRMEMLNRIHVRMLEAVRNKGGQIDAVFVCPHAANDLCRCRPPAPGLYEQIGDRLKINLAGVFAVCVNEDEAAAAQAAGARPVIVSSTDKQAPNSISRFASLADFVEDLVTNKIVH